MILEKGLENIYKQSIIDWHILNSTGEYSRSQYLLRIDLMAEEKLLYKRDTSLKVWVLDRGLVNDTDSMRSMFPGKVIDFLKVKLSLFESAIFPIERGDTIVVTLFPETKDKLQLNDPIDGIIHTIYYLENKVIRVGQNDYTEFEIPDSLLRQSEKKLIELIKLAGKDQVDETLWYLTE